MHEDFQRTGKKNLFPRLLLAVAALSWTSAFCSSQQSAQEDSIAFTLSLLKEALKSTYIRIEGPSPSTPLQRACANVVFLEYSGAYLRELQDPDWTKNSHFKRPLQTSEIEGALEDFATFLAAVHSDNSAIESNGFGTLDLVQKEISRLRKESRWPGLRADPNQFTLEEFMQSELNENLLECRRVDLISHLRPEISKLPESKKPAHRYAGKVSQTPTGGIQISVQRKL